MDKTETVTEPFVPTPEVEMKLDRILMKLMDKDNYPDNIDPVKLGDEMAAIVDCNEQTLRYFGKRAIELGEAHNNPMGTLVSALVLAFLIGIELDDDNGSTEEAADE
jgi:hypothetical protein